MKQICGILTACIILGITIQQGHADEPSSAEIVNALDPQTAKPPITRSWQKRGVTIQKGDDEKQPPSVNLYINFAYDSASLMTDSQIILDSLANALIDERLASYNFLVAGHTDAKGSDEYNLALSDRRAQAVVRYLVSKYKIDPSRLQEKGFGETQLLDPQHPEDELNRRVQIINISGDVKE
jgi:outer membrane protein OmpA-like peptidoglycan-associated protein